MTRTNTDGAVIAEIKAACKRLQLPTVSARSVELAEDARRAAESYESYLAALLAAECDDRTERRRRRLVTEAHFPRLKTIEEFRFADNPAVSAREIRELGTADFCRRAENVILLGDSGTGKTHLGIAIGIAACHASLRVRFTTTAGLVNELIEARDERVLSKVIHRYAAADLLVLDELAYVPLQPADAELLFQVIDARTEHGSILVTTNLPFSEWTQVFPETRLCKAVVDRLTFNAHIIETGTDSWRFKRSAARRGASKRASS
ncbi:MAG: IS21-like element helper ATPase IstB [Chloroflexota bacterium]